MRVSISVPIRCTEDWTRVDIEATVNTYYEDTGGLGEHIDFDIDSITITREDDSVIEDLDIDDLLDMIGGFDYRVLEAMMIEEYLSNGE